MNMNSIESNDDLYIIYTENSYIDINIIGYSETKDEALLLKNKYIYDNIIQYITENIWFFKYKKYKEIINFIIKYINKNNDNSIYGERIKYNTIYCYIYEYLSKLRDVDIDYILECINEVNDINMSNICFGNDINCHIKKINNIKK